MTFRPTDLAAMTAELASSFRSATERAGLRLVVDAQLLSQPVYVDRDMWETIVLNLMSNAFKFTFEGEIGVELREERRKRPIGRARHAGSAFPPTNCRSSSIASTASRARAGAASKARASVWRSSRSSSDNTAAASASRAKSAAARPSRSWRRSGLRICRPSGSKSTQDDAPVAVRAQSFVEEALRWLPGGPGADILFDAGAAQETRVAQVGGMPAGSPEPRRVLLADDNADLRSYIARLLADRGYEVETVVDGMAALEAARATRPDLLITDVMMPRLDGFGLLRALRADPELRDLPVVILSARAGEEAKVEGLDAGADDYLIKPFSARELLARVSAVIAMASIRREAREAVRASEALAHEQAERVQLALDAGAIIGTWVWDVKDDRLVGDERFARSFGLDPELCRLGLPLDSAMDAIHEDDRPRVGDTIAEALRAPGRLPLRVPRPRRGTGRSDGSRRMDAWILPPTASRRVFPGC